MSNRLSRETSPYLLQHAENPVDWYPWGEEAFRVAQDQDKPILLSVGYAACHWCHVMSHESFEDPQVAALMNAEFVNVKVDRQERPDVDDVYQKVVQMIGQGGGWPLTVFLTPKGEPFFGGTYFPPRDGWGRPSFTRLIRGIGEAWRLHRNELETNIEQFRAGYRILDQSLREAEVPLGLDAVSEAARALADATDPEFGGLGGAPKFPNPCCQDLILRVHFRIRDEVLLRALTVTLDHMATGGLYDQLGGGFSRYSVDERWGIPHFEKMLYDNGQLVKLYADAYRATGNALYRRVVEESVAYVRSDMTHPSGAFYSSEDADSEGSEGKFYVWTPSEVVEALGADDGAFVCDAYGVTDQGNFDRRTTVLHLACELDKAAEERLCRLRKRLHQIRSQRVRPARDENVLTCWNALMIQGLCAAYQALGRDEDLHAAERAASFILEQLVLPNGELCRVYKDGQAKIPAFLDDYAGLANALLDLYESSFERQYLDWAVRLADAILAKFWDGGPFFTPNDGEQLIHRPRAAHDHAWPSGTSASAFVMLRLHELTGRVHYGGRVESVLKQHSGAVARDPFGFAHLLAAVDFAQSGPLNIVIAGDRREAQDFVQSVHRAYLPNRVIAFADDVPSGAIRPAQEGRPTAYVCRRRVCGPPVGSSNELLDHCMARLTAN